MWSVTIFLVSRRKQYYRFQEWKYLAMLQSGVSAFNFLPVGSIEVPPSHIEAAEKCFCTPERISISLKKGKILKYYHANKRYWTVLLSLSSHLVLVAITVKKRPAFEKLTVLMLFSFKILYFLWTLRQSNHLCGTCSVHIQFSSKFFNKIKSMVTD